MALSKEVRDSLLANEVKKAEAFATPYRTLAAQIKQSMEEAGSLADQQKENRASTWDMFKQALGIASAENHTQLALRVGMEIACDQAGVPGGSFRSYLSTVVNLYSDIKEGNLSLKEAQELSIAQARALYRVVTPVQEARNALLEAVSAWSPEEIMVLVTLTKGEAEPETVEEVIHVAEVHALEAIAEAEQASDNDNRNEQHDADNRGQEAAPARAVGGRRH